MMDETDFADFVEAQDELRRTAGNPCTFRIPQDPAWPDGTRVNPDTGRPYDATVVRANAEFTEVTVTVLVIVKKGSPLRPQSSEQWSALGMASGTDIIIDVSDEDSALTAGASEFGVLGLDYRLEDRKPFGIGGTVYRYLVYGQEM